MHLLRSILRALLFAILSLTAIFTSGQTQSITRSATMGAPVGNLKVASGFKAELLYSVPRPAFGSWIALCFDNKGRIIVADQSSGLYRLTIPPIGGGGQVQVEPIEIDIGGVHGLLYAFDSLYVMVNERNTQGIYRIRDTDGDDRFDQLRVIRNLSGTGEHGTHSMTLSPDGQSIYVVVGNSSSLTQLDSSQHPPNIGLDSLLPVLTGFNDGQQPNGGYVARMDPEGMHWEMVSFGFRNPYRISFNTEGELFTYDADAEGTLGHPWYRPTRINHLISGADFGWRPLVNKWPSYYFDSFGEVITIGSGSPTGSTFGTGAKFPPKYQRAFFAADWSFGKLYAIHLTPTGATYVGSMEEFITGQPFPISDVVISPHDGAMYLIVGGRSTQSALYRITYDGPDSTAPAPADLRGHSERQVRRQLESYHGVQHESAVDQAWRHLGDQDRATRYAARLALEWQESSSWRERALTETNPRVAIAAIAALARASTMGVSYSPQTGPSENAKLQVRMLDALERIDWRSLSDADQIDLARTYTLIFTRTGQPDESRRSLLAAKFEEIFPARAREANALLARLLVYLEAPATPAKLVAAMRTAPSQQEQIDYALQLRLQRSGWTQSLREEYFNWFIDAYANYRGGNFFLSGIINIRAAALETLTAEEKLALRNILAITPTQVSPLQRVVDRPFVRDWTVDELTPIVQSKLDGGGRDFDRGRRLFGEVACAACHGFGSEGGSVGPELTGSGGRYSVRDLLESIIEPSKVISDQFAATTFTLADGSTITGRVANAQADTISVSVNMFDYTQLEPIHRSDIVAMEESTVSMMPPGMINNLNEEQISDLVAYLLSLNDRAGTLFKK